MNVMRIVIKDNSLSLLLSILALLLLASCGPQAATVTVTEAEPANKEDLTVIFETESVYFSPEELMAQADLIFAGEVLAISPTQWNHKSGEYWTETTVEGVTAEGEELTTTHSPWPVYEVRLSVAQSIVDEVGIDREVVLTLLGKSPVDATGSNSIVDGVQVDADTVNLRVGQEVIVFAQQTELAWRDPDHTIQLITNSDGTSYFDIGTRSITTLMGVYENAYMVKGNDGLYHPAEGAFNEQEPISLDSLLQTVQQVRGN